jgi:hypothetical protein
VGSLWEATRLCCVGVVVLALGCAVWAVLYGVSIVAQTAGVHSVQGGGVWVNVWPGYPPPRTLGMPE